MTDKYSPAKRRRIMQSVRTKGTALEDLVAEFLRQAGIQFERNCSTLPGSPDFRLLRESVVLFVNGCFWHGHERCRKGVRRPTSNAEFWTKKLLDNRRRDRRVAEQLRKLGYSVYTLWECRLRVRKTRSQLFARIRRVSAEKRGRRPKN